MLSAGSNWASPTLTDQLHGVLSNKEIFGSDLYEAGVAQKIEVFFKEIAGPGAVRATLKKVLALTAALETRKPTHC